MSATLERGSTRAPAAASARGRLSAHGVSRGYRAPVAGRYGTPLMRRGTRAARQR